MHAGIHGRACIEKCRTSGQQLKLHIYLYLYDAVNARYNDSLGHQSYRRVLLQRHTQPLSPRIASLPRIVVVLIVLVASTVLSI